MGFKISVKVCLILFFIMFLGAWIGLPADIVLAAGPYVDNNDGTVTDTGSKLMWPADEDGIRREWASALKYCEVLSFAGYGDWRIPTRDELAVLSRDVNPAVSGGVGKGLKTRSSQYWTGTGSPVFSSVAWYVDFYRHDTGTYHKQVKFFVRCVRDVKKEYGNQ